jgi:hypothetical protein
LPQVPQLSGSLKVLAQVTFCPPLFRLAQLVRPRAQALAVQAPPTQECALEHRVEQLPQKS